MNHRMTVWANRTKVANGVDLVTRANFRNWQYVVNVNVVSTEGPIPLLEHETAYCACWSKMDDACLTRGTIPFV